MMNTTSSSSTPADQPSSSGWFTGAPRAAAGPMAVRTMAVKCQICPHPPNQPRTPLPPRPRPSRLETFRRCSSCELPACLRCMPADARFMLEDGSRICRICHYIRFRACSSGDIEQFDIFNLQQFADVHKIGRNASAIADKPVLCQVIFDNRDSIRPRRTAPTNRPIRHPPQHQQQLEHYFPYPTHLQPYQQPPPPPPPPHGFSYEVQHFHYQTVMSRPADGPQQQPQLTSELTTYFPPHQQQQQQPTNELATYFPPHQQQQQQQPTNELATYFPPPQPPPPQQQQQQQPVPYYPVDQTARNDLAQAFNGLNRTMNQAAATMSHLATDMENVFDTVNEAIGGGNGGQFRMVTHRQRPPAPTPRVIQERRVFVEQKHTLTITRPILPPPQPQPIMTQPRFVHQHHPPPQPTRNQQPPPPPQPPLTLAAIRTHREIEALTPRQLVTILDEYLVPHERTMARPALINQVKRLFDEENRTRQETTTTTTTATESDDADDCSCKICMAKRAEYAFIDCGHMVACLDCSKKLKICPICRCNISKTIRIFKS